MKRRWFLTVLGAIGFAGCNQGTPSVTPTGTPTPTTSPSPEGTDTPDAYRHSAALATEKANLSAEEKESAEIVRFDSLPEDEQALVETALTDGYQISCDTPPDDSAWWAFAHRPDRMDAYVEYQGAMYGLWLRITDMVFIDTAAAPPEEEVEQCQ